MKNPKYTLKSVRAAAAQKGLRIDTQRDMYGWSYWILNADGTDPQEDDNFYTQLNDVMSSIKDW
jgi:hypothetical protein